MVGRIIGYALVLFLVVTHAWAESPATPEDWKSVEGVWAFDRDASVAEQANKDDWMAQMLISLYQSARLSIDQHEGIAFESLVSPDWDPAPGRLIRIETGQLRLESHAHPPALLTKVDETTLRIEYDEFKTIWRNLAALPEGLAGRWVQVEGDADCAVTCTVHGCGVITLFSQDEIRDARLASHSKVEDATIGVLTDPTGKTVGEIRLIDQIHTVRFGEVAIKFERGKSEAEALEGSWVIDRQRAARDPMLELAISSMPQMDNDAVNLQVTDGVVTFMGESYEITESRRDFVMVGQDGEDVFLIEIVAEDRVNVMSTPGQKYPFRKKCLPPAELAPSPDQEQD